MSAVMNVMESFSMDYSGSKGFSRRLVQALDSHPDVPQKHHGRLTWLRKKLADHGTQVALESVRKWVSNEGLPRVERVEDLAEILNVDVAWLFFGYAPETTPKQRRLELRQNGAAVTLVASMLQMAGRDPVVSDPDDEQAAREEIDIRVVIKGAFYQMHVALARVKAGKAVFSLPQRRENLFVLGVFETGPFCYTLLELDNETVEQVGKPVRGRTEVTVNIETLRAGNRKIRQIESFSARL